jgi:hypothetical protein
VFLWGKITGVVDGYQEGDIKMKDKLAWFFLAGAASAGGYWIVRRLGTRRGANDQEVHASLPGDALIPHPMVETTHAISIQAPPSLVWKWLIQAGYPGSGRAGWYSDSWLDAVTEGLFLRFTVPGEYMTDRLGLRSANQILPEYQHTQVGDIVPDGPPGSAYFVVKAVESEHAWVLYSDTHIKYMTPLFLHGTPLEAHGEFTWAFVLHSLEEDGTRLILRTRARYDPAWIGKLMLPLFYLGEAILPLLILRGMKARTEEMAAAGSAVFSSAS